MRKSWPRAPLDDVLGTVSNPVDVKPEATYCEIGIRSHGHGIFHKSPVTGADIGGKRVFWMKPGAFVLNIVFAWEGAVGILSDAETGMIGSHRFPTWMADETRLDSRFLLAYFRTPAGLELLGRVSPGGAGRNRTLSRSAFLKESIPLPPLAEQRRAVARIEELAAQINEARTLRHQATQEAEALVASGSNALFTGGALQNCPRRSLGEVAEIRSGVTLGRRLTGRTIRMPYLRVANVQDGRLDLSEIKQVEVLESEAGKWLLRHGDILLTEGGDWDKLGRGTVWQEEIQDCIHQNHIFRVRVKSGFLLPGFLAKLISSPVGKAYFQEASKQTTNLASINQRQLKAFKVIQPTLAEQRRIVAELDALQAEVDALKRLQAETSAQLDALLPSILDRAFSGGL